MTTTPNPFDGWWFIYLYYSLLLQANCPWNPWSPVDDSHYRCREVFYNMTCTVISWYSEDIVVSGCWNIPAMLPVKLCGSQGHRVNPASGYNGLDVSNRIWFLSSVRTREKDRKRRKQKSLFQIMNMGGSSELAVPWYIPQRCRYTVSEVHCSQSDPIPQGQRVSVQSVCGLCPLPCPTSSFTSCDRDRGRISSYDYIQYELSAINCAFIIGLSKGMISTQT